MAKPKVQPFKSSAQEAQITFCRERHAGTLAHGARHLMMRVRRQAVLCAHRAVQLGFTRCICVGDPAINPLVEVEVALVDVEVDKGLHVQRQVWSRRGVGEDQKIVWPRHEGLRAPRSPMPARAARVEDAQPN